MQVQTPRQKQILAFIQQYYQAEGVAPTLREIQAHLGLASVSTVARHIDLLRQSGQLPTTRGRRTLIPPGTPVVEAPVTQAPSIEIPFLGFFDPNQGIETLPIPRTFTLPPGLELDPSKGYALKVRGDGLSEEGVLDGDILIIEAGAEVEAGRPALIRDGGEWWVRRCYPTGEYLSLESLTGQGAPIVRAIHRVELLGALVALWRLYDF